MTDGLNGYTKGIWYFITNANQNNSFDEFEADWAVQRGNDCNLALIKRRYRIFDVSPCKAHLPIILR
jgi:hypothetical protein